MEVNRQAKGLSKHAVPVVMMAAALMTLPAAAAMGNINFQKLAGGLAGRIISVHPTPNGLANFTANNSPASDNLPAGSYLNDGLNQAGRQTQLWLQLQR